jgi:hypothetical protein
MVVDREKGKASESETFARQKGMYHRPAFSFYCFGEHKDARTINMFYDEQ